jgi:hypothetical protein
MATESCFLRTRNGWLEIEADAKGVTAVRFVDAAPVRSLYEITYPHLKEAYKQLTDYFRGERLEGTGGVWARLAEATESERNIASARPRELVTVR